MIDLTGGTRCKFSNGLEYKQSSELEDATQDYTVTLRHIPPQDVVPSIHGVIIRARNRHLNQEVISLGGSSPHLNSEIIDEEKRPEYESYLTGQTEVVLGHNRELSWEEGRGVCERILKNYQSQSSDASVRS